MPEPTNHAHDALLALTLTSGLGPTLTRRAVEHFGTAENALQAGEAAWAKIQGIGARRARDIVRNLHTVLNDGTVEREKQIMAEHDVTLRVWGEGDYPPLLKHIPDAPPVLYVRGDLQFEDGLSLAIVGSRRCTLYGREQAERFSAMCAQAGLCVVSGGAEGIDAAAHHAALRVGGRTIAVLGSGIARPYPRHHDELFKHIADGHGAVVSELPMTVGPAAENFPRRNRIISGLALGVVVVEAAMRSGALITARLASEEHGREVMAVPGRVDSAASAGCHKMIREGWATLVTNAADVLDALGEPGRMLREAVTADAARDGREAVAGRIGPASSVSPPTEQPAPLFAQKLTPDQRAVLAAASDPRSMDDLVRATSLSASVVQASLTVLQVLGLVQKDGGVFVQRR